MSDSKKVDIIWVWFFSCICIVMGFCMGLDAGKGYTTQIAVDNGAVYYDPIKKEFVWIKREPVKVELKVTPSNEEKN